MRRKKLQLTQFKNISIEANKDVIGWKKLIVPKVFQPQFLISLEITK